MHCPLCSSTHQELRHAVKAYTYVTCTACGVTILSPFPTPEEIQNWYTDETYFSLEDGNCGYTDYLALEKGLHRTFLRRNRLLGKKSFWANKEILEVGCALGFYPDAMKNIPGLKYTGLDLNGYAIDVLRKKGFNGIQGDMHAVPQDNRYDIIAFFDVLEHIPDPFPFLSSIRSRMQNNGHILFTTPSTRSFLSKISGAKWVSYIVPHHVLLYEPVVLKRLLNACGFDQVKIMADIQWVPLSFLNERLSKLTGLLKGLTRYLKQQEQEGHQVFIPVSNGQMLVHARKLQLPGVHENEDPYRKNFLC